VINPRRGDFVLIHGSHWTSWLVQAGQAFRYRGDSRRYTYWNHAAIFSDDAGHIIEALGAGVVERHISVYDPAHYHLVFLPRPRRFPRRLPPQGRSRPRSGGRLRSPLPRAAVWLPDHRQPRPLARDRIEAELRDGRAGDLLRSGRALAGAGGRDLPGGALARDTGRARQVLRGASAA